MARSRHPRRRRWAAPVTGCPLAIVAPSMPTGAPNYGHVPVDMALKKPHDQAAWTCPHAGKHRESDSRVLPALRHQKHHTTESQGAIRAHKAVSATNARFPNSVVTYGNEHMSTKPQRETAQPKSTATYPHTNARLTPTAHQSTQAGRSSPSRPAMSVQLPVSTTSAAM